MKVDPRRAFYSIPDGQWDASVVGAFKAMEAGKARPDQQQAFVNFVIGQLAGTYDLSFRPDDLGGDRDTAFAEGRRFVGQQIRRVIMTDYETLTGRKPSGENPE